MKNVWFWSLLFVHLLFTLLFFDVKAHPGGDDADYVIASVDFLNGISFPTWHGSLYPIVLSPLIALFGVELILFKIASVLMMVGAFFILHHILSSRVSHWVYYFVMTIAAGSYGLCSYSSTTYSEPLFILLQTAVVYFYLRSLDVNHDLRCIVLTYGWLAFLVVCLSLTRNVGLGAAIAIVVVLMIDRNWLKATIFSGGFILINSLFTVYKKYYWDIAEPGIKGQFSRIGLKNFYNPADGVESFWGYVGRFWLNSEMYISRHLAHMLGMRGSGPLMPSTGLTIFFYCIFFIALVLSYKRNRFVFFITLYIGVMLAVTFITQQIHWDQERLILVYLTLIAIVVGFLLDHVASWKQRGWEIFARVFLILLPSLVVIQTIGVPKNIWNTLSEIQGKKYSGYPPGWKNYAQLAEWTGSNVPDSVNVLCRKSGIARIYGNRHFTGISNFHTLAPDSADAILIRKNVDFVILDDLEMPTISRLLGYFLMKYPLGLELVKVQGTTNRSCLLKIRRDQPKTHAEYFSRINGGLAVQPNIPYFYMLAGGRCEELNRLEEATQYYTVALRTKITSEERRDIQFHRARMFARLRKMESAQRIVDDLIKESPNDKKSWMLRGYIFQEMGLLLQAQDAYQKAKQIEKNG